MARQVTVSVECAGKPLAPGRDFQVLLLHQTLFDHHSLSLVVPFDRVEGSKSGFLGKAPQQFLGQPITVSVASDKVFDKNNSQGFDFKGLITEMGSTKDSDLSSSLLLHGYSSCCRLNDGMQKRTFLNQTLQAIFEQVTAPVPGNVLARKLAPSHKAPISYVVQYKESNYAFLCRLATEYGEWFFYDGTTLQLGPPSREELEFVADGVHNTFHLGLTLGATQTRFYEYSYRDHKHFSASTKDQRVPAVQQHPFSRLALQQSELIFAQESRTMAETRIRSTGEITEEARDFKAQRVADLVALQGSSDNSSFQLGRVIRVRGHGLGTESEQMEDFGNYRVIEVTHRVDAEGNYSNTFTAIPRLLEIPPLNPTYAPPVGQQELADVLDTQDPEHLGRVRVRYQWDVAKPRDAESDWLRVLAPYSGDGKGHLFTPEVGSQVLVGYEHGLAEFPLVLGNLFHASNQQGAKYSTENNHLKGIQTAGGNKVVMSDKKGEQTIHLSNSNNKGTAVKVSFKGDGSVHIQSNGPVTVNGSVITLDAGDEGAIKLHAKTISLEAEGDIVVNSKKEGIALKAETKMALTSKELLAVGSEKATVQSTTELALNGGSKATLQSGKTKVH